MGVRLKKMARGAVVLFTCCCVLALVCLVARHRARATAVSLEKAPKMVSWLEVARKKIKPTHARTHTHTNTHSLTHTQRTSHKLAVDDATRAGLKALGSKDSLAATVTGGLKSTVERAAAGDSALLHRIESASKTAAALAAPAAKDVPGARGRDEDRGGAAKPPVPVMQNVVAAVQRDRQSQMRSMSKELARVALLREQVQ
ncbi:MAG: hypothetical protein ACPIOQ_33355, partial [Promethearchaeia archaeon]